MNFQWPDHHRRSIRLKDYDYTQAGAYFITLVAWERYPLFGEIRDGECVLSHFGKIIMDEWLKTPTIRPLIELDEFVVMPNHFHGIIMIANDGIGLTADGQARHRPPYPHQDSIAPIDQTTPSGVKPGSLGAILGQIKSVTTKQINQARNTPGAPVWQRNYFEHIIRNERELDRIRAYIAANPQRWADDDENPAKGQ